VVADAQREADEYVAAKRVRAEEIAANHVAAVEADIAEQVKRAKDEARKAHAKAEQAIERARDQMRQARELAEAIPLLRVEGVVALRHDGAQQTSTSSAAAGPRMIDTMTANVKGAADRAPLGRDLAEAEAIISGIHRSGSQPRSRVKPIDKINS
jgi:hypothetical protein